LESTYEYRAKGQRLKRLARQLLESEGPVPAGTDRIHPS
jgi:hypothetical protein